MKEHTGKNKIFIVIIICLCAVIIAGLIYFMKLKGGSDSAFKPDLDSNAKTQTADDTGEKPTGIRIPGYPSITTGFHVLDHELKFYGQCRECQKRGRKK